MAVASGSVFKEVANIQIKGNIITSAPAVKRIQTAAFFSFSVMRRLLSYT